MAPFAVLFTAMFMALFWGAAGATFRTLKGASPLRVLLFASALSGFEWLRGHILTGFPVGPSRRELACGRRDVPDRIGGRHLRPDLAHHRRRRRDLRRARATRRHAPSPSARIAVVVGLFAFGAARVSRPLPASTGPLIRIVQADVRQETKYDQERLLQHRRPLHPSDHARGGADAGCRDLARGSHPGGVRRLSRSGHLDPRRHRRRPRRPARP